MISRNSPTETGAQIAAEILAEKIAAQEKATAIWKAKASIGAKLRYAATGGINPALQAEIEACQSDPNWTDAQAPEVSWLQRAKSAMHTVKKVANETGKKFDAALEKAAVAVKAHIDPESICHQVKQAVAGIVMLSAAGGCGPSPELLPTDAPALVQDQSFILPPPTTTALAENGSSHLDSAKTTPVPAAGTVPKIAATAHVASKVIAAPHEHLQSTGSGEKLAARNLGNSAGHSTSGLRPAPLVKNLEPPAQRKTFFGKKNPLAKGLETPGPRDLTPKQPLGVEVKGPKIPEAGGFSGLQPQTADFGDAVIRGKRPLPQSDAMQNAAQHQAEQNVCMAMEAQVQKLPESKDKTALLKAIVEAQKNDTASGRVAPRTAVINDLQRTYSRIAARHAEAMDTEIPVEVKTPEIRPYGQPSVTAKNKFQKYLSENGGGQALNGKTIKVTDAENVWYVTIVQPTGYDQPTLFWRTV